MRTRRIRRIEQVESPQSLRRGFGYGDPVARQAELIDMMTRPGMRRAATLVSRFPNEPVMRKAEPLSLRTSEGVAMLMVGDVLSGRRLR